MSKTCNAAPQAQNVGVHKGAQADTLNAAHSEAHSETQSEAGRESHSESQSETHSSAESAAESKAQAAGRAQATARIKSILSAAQAAGREAQAMVLAFETSMSAQEAIKVLSASPKASHLASIEARSAAHNTFGEDGSGASGAGAEQIIGGWSAAVQEANKRFTALDC